MKVLKKIDYIDVVYFRKASLVLDAEGTTFVTGLNRNSSKGRKSNGAGKTLLVSGVSHLRHGSPVGTAQSLHRNSLLSSPNSRMEWEIENPEGNWRFAKYRQGKAIKWDVSLNGEPLLFKTATQAEQAAAKVFDFNDEEFYSTVYLDSRRPNPVLHGTGTARQAFLSGLFRLEGYAAIKSWFVERLKDARAKEAAMRELEDAVRDVSGDAKDVDKAKTRLAKLDGQVDELEKKAVGLRDDLETRRSFDLFRKLGKSAAKYDKDVLKKAEDVLHAWRQYEANEDFRKEQMERLAVYEKDAAALKRTLKEAREKNTTALAAAVAAARTQREHMESHLKEKDSETCPYCGRKLSSKTAQAKLEAALRMLKDKQPLLDRARIAEGRLGRGKPKVPKKTKQPEMSRKQAEKTANEQKKHKKASDAMREAKGEAGSDLPDEENIIRSLEKATSELKETTKKKDAQAARLSEIKAFAKSSRKTREKIKQLADATKDIELLDVLADAYGPKGLRVLALKNIALAIEGNLNSMSPFLCPEKMEFKLDVSSANSMDVSVTRADGRTSDVRHLSGAESRIFQLLWTAAVLPLLPSERRCNAIILDEFEAGMDETTRKLLIDEYLPRLCKLVPHVVFLSPYDVEPDVGRRVLRVEKKGGRSIVKTLSED